MTMQAPITQSTERTSVGLLARLKGWFGPVAGLIGLGAALLTALGPLRTEAPAATDGIATVDGRAIPRATYARAIAALEADKRNPLSVADRRLALSRLVDEELLVRRGLDLGLAETEPTVRKALVDAMLQLASVPEARNDPDEAELRRFYGGRPTLFASEPLLTITAASHPASDTERSERLSGLLRNGTPFAAAVTESGAQLLPAAPALASLRKIADYVGPTIAEAAGILGPGEAAGPIIVAGRAVYILVHDRQEGQRPTFETVREQVVEAWRRAARDTALERYLAGLRGKSDITFASDAPR